MNDSQGLDQDTFDESSLLQSFSSQKYVPPCIGTSWQTEVMLVDREGVEDGK